MANGVRFIRLRGRVIPITDPKSELAMYKKRELKHERQKTAVAASLAIGGMFSSAALGVKALHHRIKAINIAKIAILQAKKSNIPIQMNPTYQRLKKAAYSEGLTYLKTKKMSYKALGVGALGYTALAVLGHLRLKKHLEVKRKQEKDIERKIKKIG